MGRIDFPPLEPQETEEDNNIIFNSTTQIQKTSKELWNILKDKDTKDDKIKDIEPLPLGDN